MYLDKKCKQCRRSREESGDNEVPKSGPEALSAGSGEPEGPAEPPEPAEPEGTAPGAGEERSGAEEAAPAGGDPEPAARGEAEEAEREEREALLAEYRALEAERQRLHQADGRLQLLLGEALRSQRGERRADEAGGQQLFAERLRELRELWRRREREAATWQQRVDARRRDRAESEARAGAAWAAFQARKKAVAVQTLGRRRGGREAALRTVGDIQARERDKETSVREVSAAPPAPRALPQGGGFPVRTGEPSVPRSFPAVQIGGAEPSLACFRPSRPGWKT